MTRGQIILKTIRFYAADPEGRRSIELRDNRKPRCFYTHPDDPDKHCAVGRCMTSKALNAIGVSLLDVAQLAEELPNMKGVGKHLGSTSKDSIDKALRKEYRGHSVKFWQALQSLHDDSDYWDKDKGMQHRRNWCLAHLPMNTPEMKIMEDEGLIAKGEPVTFSEP